jgi:hypothetical protein
MDRWTYVKVTPGNQTLILASERGPAAGMPARALSQSVPSRATDAVLQRITIVAARPDSTVVYLRADYAAEDRSPLAPASARTYDATRQDIVPGDPTQPRTPARAGLPAPRPDPYGSNRGISLYTSTHRMSLETITAVHVDVHA